MGTPGNVKHGMWGTRIYDIWHGIKQRTQNPNFRDYPRYGGRGITLCDDWQDFTGFYADMGDAPEGLSIERKDNDGPYCKENCVWADDVTQARNRRNNHILTVDGESLTIIEWVERTGIAYGTIHSRVYAYGWDHKKAVTKPIRKDSRHAER